MHNFSFLFLFLSAAALTSSTTLWAGDTLSSNSFDISNFQIRTPLPSARLEVELTLSLREITAENLSHFDHSALAVSSLVVTTGSLATTVGITAEHIKLLAQTFPSIKRLRLSNTGLRYFHIQEIVASGFFPSLEVFDISNNSFINDSAAALVLKARFANKLKVFNVTITNVTYSMAGQLVKKRAEVSPYTAVFPVLEYLIHESLIYPQQTV